MNPMDVDRVELLIRYILAVAGEEEADNRELGPIHIIKYLYIGDVAYAESHNGKPFTGTRWRFYHFGPWAAEVFDRIEPVAAHLGANRRTIVSTRFENDHVRYSFADEHLLEELQNRIPTEVARAIRRSIRRFGSDTSELLHYVYTTPPMLQAAPGEVLEFTYGEMEHPGAVETAEAEPNEIEQGGSVVARSKTRQKRELEAVRERVRARLEKGKHHKGPAVPLPRYDCVFFDGVNWLDDLAGEEIDASRGEAVFSSDVWKSRGRRDPGVP